MQYSQEEIREMQSFLWRKSQLDEKEKSNIMKNVLIIGLGRFVRHIAMQLNQLGHEIMAVDWNEERVDKVLPLDVYKRQSGSSISATTLRMCGRSDRRWPGRSSDSTCMGACNYNYQNADPVSYTHLDVYKRQV